MNFNCNTNIGEDEFTKVFAGRIISRPKFFFIPKFLRFQYPKGLNSNKPAIVSVVKELHQNNLSETVNKLFGNDYLIIKDKDKDKDTDKAKDKDNGQRHGLTKLELFESLFSDQIFVEQLSIAHKGKDIQAAFEECYTHHMNAPNPPEDVGTWKQKLNGWLSNKKANNGHSNNKKQSTEELAGAFEQRVMQDIANGKFQAGQ